MLDGMNLISVGHQIAQQRRYRGLTLPQLAAAAGIGRSTLAALERGKLPELGFAKVARICEAIGLVLEVRAPELNAPLMPHRHLTEVAGRDLTKSALEDVITRGDISAWRGLVRAIRAHKEGRLARRVQDVVRGLDKEDPKARAFAALLPDILRERTSRRTSHG
jgi:transcriptional regulator with XRE-family HTH domain